MRVKSHITLCLATALLSISACGADGRYQLKWTLGCENDAGPCEITNRRQCAASGIDTVEVITQNAKGAERNRSVFPCFATTDDAKQGPVAVGPALGGGDYTLLVYSLDAAGRRLVGEPTRVEAKIPEDGSVELTADLAVPPACSDGVDNDGDSLTDGFDPGCDGAEDTDER